jgi:hypothetical protein
MSRLAFLAKKECKEVWFEKPESTESDSESTDSSSYSTDSSSYSTY